MIAYQVQTTSFLKKKSQQQQQKNPNNKQTKTYGQNSYVDTWLKM